MVNRWFTFLKTRVLCFFVVCFLSLTMGIAGPVFAADEEEEDTDEFTLEEITVTAEKREAELQKIPMDVSVVRIDDIKEMGITRAEDLDELIPDLEIDEQAGSFMAVRVRGVRQIYWTPNYEMSTAIHIDGVQLTRTNNFNNMIYDMQRVEVLKGPQGTLYGRGAIGGTINIVSQKPILEEYSGNFSIATGTDKLYQAEGAFNIPLTKKLATRASGRFVRRGGPSDNDMGSEHNWSGRLGFTWDATEKDTIVATIDLGSSESTGYGGTGYYFNSFGAINITPNPNGTTYVQTLTSTPADGPIELPYQEAWAYPYAGDSNYNNNDNTTWGAMVQWEHLLNFGYITTVYGHRSMHENKIYNRGTVSLGGTPPANFCIANPWTGAQTCYADYREFPETFIPDSEEERIANGTNGIYWFLNSGNFTRTGVWIVVNDETFSHSYNSSHTDTLESRLTSNASISNGDGYEWIVGGMLQHDILAAYNDSLALNGGGREYWAEYTTTSKGFFAQAAWTPPVSFLKEKLIFSAGYRKNLDSKKYYGKRFLAGYDLDLNNIPILVEDGSAYETDEEGNVITVPGDPREYNRIHWNVSSYKLNLAYYVTPSIMTYVQYALGYKAGSYNYDGTHTQPETNDTYEGGIKSQFFNNRLRVNLSGYYYIYNNYQQNSYAFWCEEENPEDPHVCIDVYQRNNSGYLTDENGDVILDGEGNPATDPTAADLSAEPVDLPDTYGSQLGVTMGESIQKGVSADITWMITRKNTITVNGSWSDNKMKGINLADALIAAFPDDPPDNAFTSPYAMSNTRGRFGTTPYRGNINLSHMERFGMDTLNLSLRLQYQGRTRGQTINIDQENQYDLPGAGDYWTTNLSASYSSNRWMPEGKRWNLRLSVQNLTNSSRMTRITYNTQNMPDYSGTITGSVMRKRSFTLTWGINF